MVNNKDDDGKKHQPRKTHARSYVLECAHSGGSHPGFSCPRQCRWAESCLESTSPHSGHGTPALDGLSGQEAFAWRSASCMRENVLGQNSHLVRGVRRLRPRALRAGGVGAGVSEGVGDNGASEWLWL
jgi:hypothetical protein